MGLSPGSELGLQAPGGSRASSCQADRDTGDGEATPTSSLRLGKHLLSPLPHLQPMGILSIRPHCTCACTQIQASDCLKEPNHLLGVREHKEPMHPHLHPMSCPVGPCMQASYPSSPFLWEECTAQRGRKHQAARERHREEKLGCRATRRQPIAVLGAQPRKG